MRLGQSEPAQRLGPQSGSSETIEPNDSVFWALNRGKLTNVRYELSGQVATSV